ncbi:MAG: enoyl-CoA hydratase/isomerase family protein [Syntrophobacteraceae bacterium]
MIEYEHLLHEVNDGIRVITIDRPDKLNCLNQNLWKGLAHSLKEGDENPDVHVQIITGSGRAFCAGDDISLLTQVSDPLAMKELLIDCIYGLTNTIIFLQKPLIAAVNGYAYGGGCELVLLCDLALASEKAVFAQPEGRIGAWPMIFATFGPFLVGNKISNELTMLCEPVSAQQALSFGLINRVVPHDDLMASAFDMARKVIKSSPVALKIIKETTGKILGERLYDFWISQLRSLKETSRAEDWREGAIAFIEKRQPRFKGC